jgi:hypothetical protein
MDGSEAVAGLLMNCLMKYLKIKINLKRGEGEGRERERKEEECTNYVSSL